MIPVPRRRAWLVVGMVVLGGVLAGVLAARLIAERHLETGLRWANAEVAARRFEPARRWLAGTEARGDRSGRAAYLLGVCEHAAGRPAAALEAWARVPAGSPDARRAALARAQVLVGDFGRFADAEPLLGSLLDGRDALAVEARHALFQLEFYQGRRDEMRRLIADAWPRLPDPAAELRDHWRIDGETVDRDAIASAVERAARLAPEDDRVWLARAHLATLRGNDAEARAWLDRCLARRPADPVVWRAALESARAAGDAAAFLRAAAHLPADALTASERIASRAWLASQRGDEAAERRALEPLVALHPGDTRALGRLAALALRAGASTEAESYRRRLAEAQAATVRYREALESTGRPPDFHELGRLAESLGRWTEAEGWWTLALRRSPADDPARAALARLRRRPTAPPPRPGQTLAEWLDQPTD